MEISNCLQFLQDLQNKTIRLDNKKLEYVINNYSFHLITKKADLDNNQQLIDNFKNSKIIIIDYYIKINQKNKNYFFIIGFEKTILIIFQTPLSLLDPLFSIHSELKICFLFCTENNTDSNINVKFKEIKINKDFKEEITNFNQNLFIYLNESKIDEIWKSIQSCISGYLINKSYEKANRNRIKDLNSRIFIKQTNEKIDENDYIELRNIGIGATFSVYLAYHIEEQDLLAIKKPYNQIDGPKSFQRETENYTKINHALIPKFYGTIKRENYIIIEFINGKPLSKLKEMKLTHNDKITIIFELLMIIEFIHLKKFVFRDLKPNNVMIDQNKNIVLIDFDRMVQINTVNNKNIQYTNDFSSLYAAPELNYESISFENDVYSLGKLVYYIMYEESPTNGKYFINNGTKLNHLFNNCLEDDPSKRPTINKLITEFYINYYSQIQIENFIDQYEKYLSNLYNVDEILDGILTNKKDQETQFYLDELYSNKDYIFNKIFKLYSNAPLKSDPESQYLLGYLYYNGLNGEFNINKVIYHWKLGADYNNIQSQISLGMLYYEGKYIQKEIDKTIYYWSLAANRNNSIAQYFLSHVYIDNKIDIKKGIYYLTLSANQNRKEAQFELGIYYYEGINVNQDIEKSIYYLTLSANQNYRKAQCALGFIYIESKFVQQDVIKSIRYSTLAAEQNDSIAQHNLSILYILGQYVKKDMKKALYYCSLSANNNYAPAQYNLANFYYEGKYIQKDIKKAIQLYILSANQNISLAQYFLGCFYSEKGLCNRDINKAIHYFTLAAKNNYVNALLKLGYIYYSGFLVPKDINKAIYYFTIAANKNDKSSQCNLASIYYNGNCPLDINKAIYYCTLAAKQNSPMANYNLGILYYENRFISRDIKKALNYFELAAKEQYAPALYKLGMIYLQFHNEMSEISQNKLNEMNINKLNEISQNKLNEISQNKLNEISQNKLNEISQNKLDEISQNKLNEISQNKLDEINLNISNKKILNKSNDINIRKMNETDQDKLNEFYIFQQNEIIQNISQNKKKQNSYDSSFKQINSSSCLNKAIQYFIRAANFDYDMAQFKLGLIYYEGKYVVKDTKKGLELLIKSSKNRNIEVYFVVGFLYHVGNGVDHDIEKAIHFYKEASSFNNNYAKNNLGIIYKNGFGDKIKANIDLAIEYFEEAVKQKNDHTSMFNLANVYFYHKRKNVIKIFKLLKKSFYLGFSVSLDLLCIVILTKFGSEYEKIKAEIEKIENNSNEKIIQLIIENIYKKKLFKEEKYEIFFNFFKNLEFLYNYKMKNITFDQIINQKSSENFSKNELSEEFYEGFGISIK